MGERATNWDKGFVAGVLSAMQVVLSHEGHDATINNDIAPTTPRTFACFATTATSRWATNSAAPRGRSSTHWTVPHEGKPTITLRGASNG